MDDALAPPSHHKEQAVLPSKSCASQAEQAVPARDSVQEEEDAWRLQELEDASQRQRERLRLLAEENRQLREQCEKVEGTNSEMQNSIQALELLRKQQQQ